MVQSKFKVQSIVITLLIINVVVFLFTGMVHFPIPKFLVNRILSSNNPVLIFSVQRYGFLITVFSLFPVLIKNMGWYWQFGTYMFIHGSFLHLFFNMYALYIFGKPLEERWGGREFLFFYLFTGIGAGVFTYFWNILKSPYIPTIGASGALFGVILAFGLEFPDMILLLFFFIPIKAKYAALVFGAIEVIMLMTGTMQMIGHFTHISGILFGYIYYLIRIRKGRYLRKRKSKFNFLSISNKKRILKKEVKRKNEALQLAKEIIKKLSNKEKLTSKDIPFLEYLKNAYNSATGICESNDFDPESLLCLQCEDFYACLYRYILESSNYFAIE